MLMFDQQDISQNDHGETVYKSRCSKLILLLNPVFLDWGPVIFKNQNIDKLIHELRLGIQLRYKTDKEEKAISQVLHSTWFVQLLQRTFDKDSWPAEPDPAVRNLVYGDVDENQRKRQIAIFEARVPGSSKSMKHHADSSAGGFRREDKELVRDHGRLHTHFSTSQH